MAEKIFIGKVSEKTFNNGGSIIRLSLNDKDKALIAESVGYFNIAIKKSTKGNWYAEVDTYQQNAPALQQAVSNNNYSQGGSEPIDDLPF